VVARRMLAAVEVGEGFIELSCPSTVVPLRLSARPRWPHGGQDIWLPPPWRARAHTGAPAPLLVAARHTRAPHC
jgi:hypothetical protein